MRYSCPLYLYNFIKMIGSGANGQVYLARHNTSNEEFAIKVINKDSVTEEQIDLLVNEVVCQSTINHENILKFVEYFQDEENMYFVLEYAHNGSLHDYLQKNGPLTELEAKAIFLQIISY